MILKDEKKNFFDFMMFSLFVFRTPQLLLLLPLHDYRQVIEILLSVKIFDDEFSSDLYVLSSPESKKGAFGN